MEAPHSERMRVGSFVASIMYILSHTSVCPHTHAHTIEILKHTFYTQQKYTTGYMFVILKL